MSEAIQNLKVPTVMNNTTVCLLGFFKIYPNLKFIIHHVIKNVCSFTYHKKNSETVKLRNFSFFLSSTFIYEPILIKIHMNVNIMIMQIFHFIKYDLKGH